MKSLVFREESKPRSDEEDSPVDASNFERRGVDDSARVDDSAFEGHMLESRVLENRLQRAAFGGAPSHSAMHRRVTFWNTRMWDMSNCGASISHCLISSKLRIA